MFSPRSRWSVASQGYLGTTHRVKDSIRGSTPEKSTIVLGNGYTYDKAEAARIARQEFLLYETKGARTQTFMTEQGEKRAKEAKETPPPFSTRSPKRTASPKKPVTRSDTAAERRPHDVLRAGSSSRSKRANPPPSYGDQKWNPKTQGYDGHYNWRLGK